MADYYYHGFRNYNDALKELALARQTLPNNSEVYLWSAYIGRRQGDWENATRNFERAFELDPRNFQIIQQLALAYQAQHRYQDQINAYDRSLTIVPDDLLTIVLRAWVPADWRGTLRPFQALLATYAAKDPATATQMEDINYALCERTPKPSRVHFWLIRLMELFIMGSDIRALTGKASLPAGKVTAKEPGSFHGRA